MEARHIGVDVVDIERFREQLGSAGTTFSSVFTDRELRDCAAKADRAASLAARWAAKEAYIKAWSQSLFGAPPVVGAVDFRDIEVISDAFGRVALALHGELESVAPPAASLSLSHDGNCAVAVCLV
ncbi:holo-ACP synthase [Corynebacterium liangguodongii]|uniref:Holo-ACP synthase n=1 Tax=Corynebacterium liangguodongii TaxID=2079535 RepID=A0A2S0WCN0_9CORY|nr:holo-ACP synthase [Corynebacterium liangguodongii]AWB83523.1 holo-ACP synthase [Corynebacterium liangguodongii]PWC00388.1 holo-ACP synthase [Corynebacterium liangguodongii]